MRRRYGQNREEGAKKERNRYSFEFTATENENQLSVYPILSLLLCICQWWALNSHTVCCTCHKLATKINAPSRWERERERVCVRVDVITLTAVSKQFSFPLLQPDIEVCFSFPFIDTSLTVLFSHTGTCTLQLNLQLNSHSSHTQSIKHTERARDTNNISEKETKVEPVMQMQDKRNGKSTFDWPNDCNKLDRVCTSVSST